jgi:hypothetical protein
MMLLYSNPQKQTTLAKNKKELSMKMLFKTFFGLAVLIGLGFSTAPHTSQAHAQFVDLSDGSKNINGFVVGEKLAKSTSQYAQKIVFGIAGLGAVALGALAFFGRFTWSWFFGLIGGLVLISGVNYGIQYMTGGQSLNEASVKKATFSGTTAN